MLYNRLYYTEGVWAVNCMKCGRQIPAGDVFCPDCLKIAEKYPIKPGTPIHLPNLQKRIKRVAKVRAVSPEEQMLSLQKKLRRRNFIIFLLILSLLLAVAVLAHFFFAPETKAIIGQNYTFQRSLP